MVEEIRPIDCRINIPKALRATAEAAVETEKATGRGGLLGLFPGMAERERDMTPDELVAEMDKAGVDKGIITLYDDADKDWVTELIKKYPGKFFPGAPINPNVRGIMNEIRRVKSLVNEFGLQVIRVGGWRLGVPCTDNRLFPFYTLAIEYDLKVNVNVGYPGPPGIARTQHPVYVDELCYLFPELKVVQSHTGHPWMEEAIHNVIKYPNCYLQTDSYRPRYFPPEFVQHMNTRAQDKVIWATAYPLINFKTSLDDVKDLPLRDHVRCKYLRENALRLFKW